MVNQAHTLYAELEQKGDKATAEDRQKLDKLIEDGQAKRADLDKLKALDGMITYVEEPVEEPKARERQGVPEGRKSYGQRFIESAEYKAYTPAEKNVIVKVGSVMSLLQRKALYAGTEGTGGALISAQREVEVVDIARQRPLSVVDLVGKSTTNSNLVEYVAIVERDNAAAPIAEYTGGNYGLKPESNLVFDLQSTPVRTIPTWVATSKQLLSDAPRLRSEIDKELEYMVQEELEDQALKGDGTGQNFTGINNWSGIQTRVHAVSGREFSAADTIADTLRRMITDIWLEFYRPDGIVLHPSQGEELELLKDDNKQYLKIYDGNTMKIWRVPVVETPAQTSGTATAGAFEVGATLWDREDTQILVGQPNDFFLRNAIAILAELRAAFAVKRPKAFEKATGL